ncbi:MAG: HIT family protein [Bacteroidales bacterium]|nr:HIT family protein [Bacteroidales bacterium]MDD3011713.1 HIT family protein [Bacteroidales bacterium]MDD3961395.1 HIT family protein [Bacteroidales bacterium]MDY0284869.1 HIT family protein [Bacteroidales bacterium]
MSNTCPFCSAAIRAALFAENQYCMAVYNIAPILPGHSMVIPKTHYQSIHELPEVELQAFFLFARKITDFLVTYFHGTGFDWSLQEGKEAGQSINHVHLHIIPRRQGDLESPGAWYRKLQNAQGIEIDQKDREKLDPEKMDTIRHTLRESFQHFTGKTE